MHGRMRRPCDRISKSQGSGSTGAPVVARSEDQRPGEGRGWVGGGRGGGVMGRRLSWHPSWLWLHHRHAVGVMSTHESLRSGLVPGS